MKDRISCRKARSGIHDALDRGDPVSPAEGERLTRFLPAEVCSHLERCPRCRDFLYSIESFAPLLRNQLDKALWDYQVPEVATVPQGMTERDSQVVGPQKHDGATAPAILRRFRNRLFGAFGKPVPLYRWVAVSAVAVLLVSSAIAIRIYSVSATHRVIEQQIDGVVELIYREPLLPGIESALLRSQPTISDYLEDLDRSVETWLEDTASQSYLN